MGMIFVKKTDVVISGEEYARLKALDVKPTKVDASASRKVRGGGKGSLATRED
ncbi:MAG: hypothetical protein V3S43_06295 [Acidimicrobiia bacterium]